MLFLHFLDEQDTPVTLKTLAMGGAELGGLHADATVTVEGLAPGKTSVAISGGLVHSARADVYALDDDTPQNVVVSRPIGATRIVVASEQGPVVGARVIVRNAIGSSELVTDAVGLASARLTAGVWKVRVEADGYKSQEQEVEIGSRLARLHEVPFMLLPDSAGGVRPSNSNSSILRQPVEGVGSTRRPNPGHVASGGRLRLEDVDWGEEELKVTGTDFVPYSSTVAASDDTASRFIVPVQWQSGRVQLEVARPNGTPIGNATVEVVEASGVVEAPRPLGPDGRLQFGLSSGSYVLVVSAPGFTAVKVPVSVEDDRDTVLGAEVVLRPASTDQASLTLAVFSPLIGSVEDARVLLDGDLLSGTSTAGGFTYAGLEAGPHTLTVLHPLHEPFTKEIELTPGGSITFEESLWPRASLVEVRAEYEGAPISALVRLVGPVAVKSVSIGADGHHIFRLPPGGGGPLC